jgi:hypothetical protein
VKPGDKAYRAQFDFRGGVEVGCAEVLTVSKRTGDLTVADRVDVFGYRLRVPAALASPNAHGALVRLLEEERAAEAHHRARGDAVLTAITNLGAQP